MNEVEVKFLEVNKKKLIARLLKLGAKKTFDGNISFSSFDHSALDLKSKKQLLRLRQIGDKVELCFKQDHASSKTVNATETETFVDDLEATRKIFLNLGFFEKGKASKHRVSYKLKNYHFEFDTLPDIPCYLEIEATSEKGIETAVKLIGFDMKDAKAWTMSDIFKHYNKKY